MKLKRTKEIPETSEMNAEDNLTHPSVILYKTILCGTGAADGWRTAKWNGVGRSALTFGTFFQFSWYLCAFFPRRRELNK